MEIQSVPFCELTKEEFLQNNKIKTNSIYLLVISTVLLSLILLPFIKISLSVEGNGIIRPKNEKAEIKAVQPELVTDIFVTEGQFVTKGDTLLTLRQDILYSKIEFLQQELTKQQIYINDLKRLTNSHKMFPTSEIYISQYNSYKQKLNEFESKISKAEIDITRNKMLFEKEFISAKEFEDIQFNLIHYQEQKSIMESIQISEWKADLEKYSLGVGNLKKQIEELEKQKRFYVITTPVSGTIEEFSGIYVGSILQTGQTVAVISPESDKIAEIFISAKNIGYLGKGQKTIIQVDAFNYNQWGVIEGEIIDISDDFILVDNTPVFLIKCELSKDYLELKNGVKGNIKKGMTVNARFMLAKRSLFQLLYQKSDDWLNPSRNLVSEK